MAVARQISEYLNSFQLAFKTYNKNDFEMMLKNVAGESAHLTPENLTIALLERGFMIYPPISESEDGYVRVIRTNSLIGTLLNAFRYVGRDGDSQLAKIIVSIKRRNRPDELYADALDGET